MRKVLTALTVAMLLTGCGAIAERAAEEVAEQALEQAAEGDGNANVDLEFGGGDLPDGLNTEVPDGYEVLGSTSFSDDESSVVSTSLIYPGDEVENLVEYFEDHFAGMQDITFYESSSDGFSTWTWSTGDGSVAVTVSHSQDDDEAMVSVSERTSS